MRITNSMLINSFLSDLSNNVEKMSKYQTQLATNRKITKLSDDPVGVINSLGVNTKINKLEQYQNNVSDAQSWLTQTETAVTDVNSVIKSLYEYSIQAANGTNSDDEYDAIKSYVQQMKEHIIQTANSTYGDKYIFGGYSTTETPFKETDSGVLYNGVDLKTVSDTEYSGLVSQKINYQVGAGINMDVSISGAELMGSGDNNILSILDDFSSALEANDNSGLSDIAGRLKNKQNDILSILADIGGKTNRLDLLSNRYDQDQLNYKSVQSDVEDIDQAEVIMQLKMTESVYNSALSVGARIIQPSLVDYLK